jgi:small subunit ribosomal protein S20
MANTKSSKKDIRRTAKKTLKNRAVKSALKTYVKKTRVAAATGDPQTTGVALIDTVSAMDKAVQRGVIHKNQAARRKSRIAKAANQVLAKVAATPKVEAAPKAAKVEKAAPAKAEKAPVAKKAAAPKAEKKAEEKKPVAKKPAAKKKGE